jgi:hypothetical protein
LALVEWHSAYFCGKEAPIPIYDRDRLPSNVKLRNPAVIEEIIWQRHRRAPLRVSKHPASSSIIVDFLGDASILNPSRINCNDRDVMDIARGQ